MNFITFCTEKVPRYKFSNPDVIPFIHTYKRASDEIESGEHRTCELSIQIEDYTFWFGIDPLEIQVFKVFTLFFRVIFVLILNKYRALDKQLILLLP